MKTPLRLFALWKEISFRGSRWLISAAFAGISISNLYAQVPVPTAQPLPFNVNFGSAHFTAYPAGISVSRGISSSFMTTLTAVEAFPDGNFTNPRALSSTQLTAPLSNSIGGTNTSSGTNPHSYLDQNNAKLLVTLSGRTWGVFWNVTTTGYKNIKVGYDLQLTERPSNNATANLETVVFLQYRYNDTGTWNTVLGSEWSTTGLNVGNSTTLSNLTLPGTANDGVKVNLRLVQFQTGSVSANDLLSFAIDNISVTGDIIPTAFAVKSPSVATPTENFPFSVSVEAQNAAGVAGPVASDESFTLSVSSGTLTGTTMGTIPAGFTSTVVSGLILNPFGSNITLSVSPGSGSSLTGTGTNLVLSVASFSGASKLAFGTITPESGSLFVAGRPFQVVVNTTNSLGQTAQVSAATTIRIVGLGANLSGNTSVVIPAGGSTATISGILSASASTSLGFTISAVSGDALTSIASGSTISVVSGPSKLLIGSIPSDVKDNQAFSLVVSAINSDGTVLSVLTPTTVIVSKISGTGNLISPFPAIILAGQSTATFTGLKFSLPVTGANIKATAVAGASLSDSDPAILNVAQSAARLVISSVLPSNTSVLTAGKLNTIRVKVVDANGNAAFIPSPSTLAFNVAAGTGSLSGTITGNTFAQGDSVITVRGLIYSKAETNVGLGLSISSGLTLGTSSIGGLTFVTDPSAGKTILYKEDFETTVKVAGQVNPTLPNGLKMYNRDGQSAITSVYGDYGTNAYVLRRIPHKGYNPVAVDATIPGVKTLFFDNSGSNYPDSNFVAFTASYFSNGNTNPQADRWLVTPAVSLTGANLKFSVQAMSFTSSGNYKDRFQLLFSQVAPGASLNTSDWEAFTMKTVELPTYPDSAQYFGLTLPITYSVNLPATFNNQVVYFAVRLNTPAGKGGDRLAIDNLLVTSSNTTGLDEPSDVVGKADLYPNPANDELSLSFNQKVAGEAFLTLYEANGKEVSRKSLGVLNAGPQIARVSINGTPEGFYVAKVSTPNKVFVSKLIIE